MYTIKYKLIKKKAKSKLISCIRQLYGNDRALLGYATSVLDDFFKCAERVAERSDIEGDEEILKAFNECIMKRMEGYGILNFYWYAVSACFDKAIDEIEIDVEDYR